MSEINELKKQIADYLALDGSQKEAIELLNCGLCPCGRDSSEGCSMTGCPLYMYQPNNVHIDFARKLLIAIEALELFSGRDGFKEANEALTQLTAAKPELKSGSGEENRALQVLKADYAIEKLNDTRDMRIRVLEDEIAKLKAGSRK